MITLEITEDHLGATQPARIRRPALDLEPADAVNVAQSADYDTNAILALALALARRAFGLYAGRAATKRSGCSSTDRSETRLSGVKCRLRHGTCACSGQALGVRRLRERRAEGSHRANLPLARVKAQVKTGPGRVRTAASRRSCPLRAQSLGPEAPAERSNNPPTQQNPRPLTWGLIMERVTRIELALSAWEAAITWGW